MDLKRPQVFDRFWCRFLYDFDSNLVPSWAPSWPYVGAKIALTSPQTPPKTRLKTRVCPDPLQASIFFDFWSIFNRFLHPWNLQNSLKSIGFYKSFSFSAFTKFLNYTIHTFIKLDAFRRPLGTLWGTNSFPKRKGYPRKSNTIASPSLLVSAFVSATS